MIFLGSSGQVRKQEGEHIETLLLNFTVYTVLISGLSSLSPRGEMVSVEYDLIFF